MQENKGNGFASPGRLEASGFEPVSNTHSYQTSHGYTNAAGTREFLSQGGRWTERESGEKKGTKKAKTMKAECKEAEIRQRKTIEVKSKEENMGNLIRWWTKEEEIARWKKTREVTEGKANAKKERIKTINNRRQCKCGEKKNLNKS
jgi:hypothetical protein